MLPWWKRAKRGHAMKMNRCSPEPSPPDARAISAKPGSTDCPHKARLRSSSLLSSTPHNRCFPSATLVLHLSRNINSAQYQLCYFCSVFSTLSSSQSQAAAPVLLLPSSAAARRVAPACINHSTTHACLSPTLPLNTSPTLLLARIQSP